MAPSRTQLNLKCYCACRRHQRCQLEEAETSVRLRVMGSSRTSHSLPLCTHLGCRAQSTIAGLKDKHSTASCRPVSWAMGLPRRPRGDREKVAECPGWGQTLPKSGLNGGTSSTACAMKRRRGKGADVGVVAQDRCPAGKPYVVSSSAVCRRTASAGMVCFTCSNCSSVITVFQQLVSSAWFCAGSRIRFCGSRPSRTSRIALRNV
jgi:hypothetical protein